MSSEVKGIIEQDIKIFLTPPNQLWDPDLNKLLYESLNKQVAGNIKREGKTYSYEDQMWEMKMKQEIAMRKRQNSECDDVYQLLEESPLSQKQKETIRERLAMEAAIRGRVTRSRNKLMSLLVLFQKILKINMGVARPHLPVLINPLLGAINSPLPHQYCIDLYKEMCKAILPDERTALLFYWTALRLLSPKTTPPSHLACTSIVDNILELVPRLPTVGGVATDLVWKMFAPLAWEILIKNCQTTGAINCVMLTLQTFSDTCRSHEPSLKLGHKMFPIADGLKLFGKVISSKIPTLKSIKAKKMAIDGFISLNNDSLDQELLENEVIDVLIECLSDKDDLLRQTTLRSIDSLGQRVFIPNNSLMSALLVTCNDGNSENSILANKLWKTSLYSKGNPDMMEPLFNLLTESSPEYFPNLTATAAALGQWLTENTSDCIRVHDKLCTAYMKKNKAPPPNVDEFGRVIAVEYKDPWEARVGVAKGLAQLSPIMSSDQCLKMIKFIIPLGLNDTSSHVREAMIDTCSLIITNHGESLSNDLMEHFDSCLSKLSDTTQHDMVRQAIVVLMGSLAIHLKQGDPKIKVVVNLLLVNLSVPSQTVQLSIAKCLVPLASSFRDEAETTINDLLSKLFESTVYSTRRGAAYGLAGIVKGLGIPSLKQYNIMTKLQSAINDKKNFRQREGALFGFEALCDLLGKLFEPYVVHLLPDLLLCFGDGNQYVREAANMAAKTIMTHLSSHGVKLVLPSLLSALEQDSWRTKVGSAELLGAMAFCAPKQLSSCLPSIVPRLMEVLTDSHSKVQDAGSQALKQIGSVIKSPEVQLLVPLLLEALKNPSNKAQPCLQALLDTEFDHKVDPPSLALIMPSVKRSLELRSADSKKMAAKVISNLYDVTDRKDLAPYLKDVLPGLKQSLTDPLPEVRSTCAKALGTMVHGVEDGHIKEVWQWLLKTLQSEATPVDRSGAAQAMAEVIKAQGAEQLEQLMPQFVSSAQNPSSSSHSRDGFLMLFIYLPMSFEKEFIHYIDKVLPPILKGLADESEYIRDTSLLAAQTIISCYADKSIDLFLPQLEIGLLHDNWRIRCSSVQLLGDLLFSIVGQSGKMSTESAEDDNFATEAINQSIINALGIEKRNVILSGLYMGRSDVALPVRQNALHVWKLVVANTARTLKDILPTLISILLNSLACDNYDKRQISAHTLADLVRKLGERVLPEIFPMLEKGLKSASKQEREGVCIGLSEIIQEASHDYMVTYSRSLIPLIRSALCDGEKTVRVAAAKTFDSLHGAVGQNVLDEVLVPLLEQLGKTDDVDQRERVLDGLQQVMAVKSNVVLPMIIPRLIQPPVNVRALSLLSSVGGQALYKHLPRVIPALVSSLQNAKEMEENFEDAVGVVLSVREEPGVGFLIEELFKAGRATKDSKRGVAMMLFEAFCSKTTIDLSEHVSQLLIFSLETFTDQNEIVCERAWLALEALVTKVIPSGDLPKFVGFVHKGLKTCQSTLRDRNETELLGFNLKGIGPLLMILKEGLVSGSGQEVKEESAHCLILVIHMASPATLTSGRVVMAIAGPLIRVMGDRYGWNVKVAVLETLVELVRKVGIAAKAFIPQLQTSYLKALNDPNLPVRNQAVIGIVELIVLSPRVDPVFNDIHNGIKKTEDPSLRNTFLQALSGVLKAVGPKVNEKYKMDIKDTLLQLQNTTHEGNRLTASSCLGILCSCLSDDQLISLFRSHLVNTVSSNDWGTLQAKGSSLSSAIDCVADRIVECGLQDEVENAVVNLGKSDRIPVCITGLDCMSSYINQFNVTPNSFLLTLTDNLSNSSMDVRQGTSECCGRITNPSDVFLKAMIAPLLITTKDKNTAVKASSERALVNLLSLDQGEEKMKYCMSILDGPIARRLEECYSRALSKIK
jgi:hypothetical protein